jgi:hypothetical protein
MTAAACGFRNLRPIPPPVKTETLVQSTLRDTSALMYLHVVTGLQYWRSGIRRNDLSE